MAKRAVKLAKWMIATMSDTTQNPETPTEQSATPKTSETKGEGSGYDAAFQSLKSENARLASQLAALEKKVADKDREIGEYKGKVDGFVRKEREGSLVAKVRAARPDLSERDIRGQLVLLAEEGKVDRFAEDVEAASKAALDALKELSPPSENKRPPGTGTAGPGTAPQQPRKPSASLDALFGIK